MSETDLNEIGNAVKELRLQAKMSQTEVAEKLGVSQGTYFRIESGAVKPNDQLINKFIRIFKISKRDLLNYGDYKKSFFLGHLKEGALDFVLKPQNAKYIQEAMINMQIEELQRKKEALFAEEVVESVVEDEIEFYTLVAPVINLFDEDEVGIDLEKLQGGIEYLKRIQQIGREFWRIDNVIIDLEGLLESKSNSDEPIDPVDLMCDAYKCVDSLTGV